MKIYLAARYSRHDELQGYARDLEEVHHTITSRWIRGGHQISDTGLSEEGSVEERERFALEDMADLDEADWVISFTEEPRSGHSRGGRHVEFGYALALEKRCTVVGPRENVFHCLPMIAVFPDWEAVRQALKADCPICAGCGQIANDDDRTPWKYWAELTPPSNLAVQAGIVQPEECWNCHGRGWVPA